MSRTGRWVFIPDKKGEGNLLGGCVIGLFIIFILFFFLYAFIAPKYEFEPTDST